MSEARIQRDLLRTLMRIVLVLNLIGLLAAGCGTNGSPQASSSTLPSTSIPPLETFATVQAAEDTMLRAFRDCAETIRQIHVAWILEWEPRYAGDDTEAYSGIIYRYFDISMDCEEWSFYPQSSDLIETADSFESAWTSGSSPLFPRNQDGAVDIDTLGFVTGAGSWMFLESRADQDDRLREQIRQTRRAARALEKSVLELTNDAEYENLPADGELINSWLLDVGHPVEEAIDSLESVVEEQLAAIAAVSRH